MVELNELMALHNISVWSDPDWRPELGTNRWLAGKDIYTDVFSSGCETCGFGAEASINGHSTASGATPSDAVRACVANIEGGAA